jgi:hypothetical protein
MNLNNIQSGIYNTFNVPQDQQNFVIKNSSFQPNSTFNNPQTISAFGENQRDMNQFRLKDNFKQNVPLVNIPNFKYLENTLDPNLNASLLSENLVQYRISIDSSDRDIKTYPDPFNYKVYFGPITNSGGLLPIYNVLFNDEKENELYNNNKFLISNDYYNEYPNYNPYILREFKNVKSIRLDNVIMPRFNKIIINHDYNPLKENHNTCIKDDFDRFYECILSKSRYIPDVYECSSLFTDRFNQIEIIELQDYRNLATNQIGNKAYSIFSDKYISPLYFKAIGLYDLKTWFDNALGNINELSFKFYNSWNQPITLNQKEILYEINYIKKIHLLNPNIKPLEHIDFVISRLTEIIKIVVLLNYKNKHVINFYNSDKLILNDDIFNTTNIIEELSEFVSIQKTFITIYKTTNKNNKKMMSIDEYIFNVFWYDNKNDKNMKNNICELYKLYKLFIYDIIVKIKIEIENIPLNKSFQNHMTYIITCWNNQLNTKINYENS